MISQPRHNCQASQGVHGGYDIIAPNFRARSIIWVLVVPNLILLFTTAGWSAQPYSINFGYSQVRLASWLLLLYTWWSFLLRVFLVLPSSLGVYRCYGTKLSVFRLLQARVSSFSRQNFGSPVAKEWPRRFLQPQCYVGHLLRPFWRRKNEPAQETDQSSSRFVFLTWMRLIANIWEGRRQCLALLRRKKA